MDCPKCKSSRHIKDGIVNSRQRYSKDCLYRYTVERKSDVKTVETNRLARELSIRQRGRMKYAATLSTVTVRRGITRILLPI